MVCYCLGITSVNPDQPDVLFERFISEERSEPPDIDVDFEHARREASVRYITPSAYAAAAEALGDREGAFAWLDLAVEQRCCSLAPILADPRLDPLRPDARFRRLVAVVRESPEREAPLTMLRVSETGRRALR